MQSHCDGEVWGLTTYTLNEQTWVVTAGDDNKIIWSDIMKRKYDYALKVSTRDEKSKRGRASTLSDLPESQCSRCVATYNELIAYAGNDGSVAIRMY